MNSPTPSPEDAGLRAASSPQLVERYAEYRLRQGRHLLHLLPREGLRAVMQLATEPSSLHPDDFDRLAIVCANLLPLPPFSTWLRDFHDHRSAYEVEGGGGTGPGLGGETVTVDLRVFSVNREEWVAALELSPSAGGWRGRVRFHAAEVEGVSQTADIFREELSSEVRNRFRRTADVTLQALLRSTLP